MDDRAGVMYVATGRLHVEEAVKSLGSWHRWMHGVRSVVFTDEPSLVVGRGFDEVRELEDVSHSFADKVGVLEQSPFERTLFLDTDTWVCGEVRDLFELLDQWDVAAVAAPMRTTWPQDDLPDAFPEVNSGVLAWRKGEATNRLWAQWRRLYADHVKRTGQTDDQPSLRRALYKTGVRLWSLPPEYNFRTVLPGFAGRGRVKIIHGRHEDMAEVERRINGFEGCRVVLPDDRSLRPGRVVVLGGSGRKWMELLTGWLGWKEGWRDRITKWRRGI